MHQEIVLGAPGQAFHLDPTEQPRGRASLVVTHPGDTYRVFRAAILDCAIDPAEVAVVEPAAAGAITLRVASSRSIGLRRPST